MSKTTFNEKTKDQLFIKIKDLPIIEFDRNLLAEDVFEVDFGGSYKLQITNENGTFVITNAMNGYGNNCYEQFKGEKVSFLDYYDYALSIANQNANPTPSKGHKSAERIDFGEQFEKETGKDKWFSDGMYYITWLENKLSASQPHPSPTPAVTEAVENKTT